MNVQICSAKVTLYHNYPPLNALQLNLSATDDQIERDGQADAIVHLLSQIKHPHEIVLTTLSRMPRILANSERAACLLYRLKTPEREQTEQFSQPLVVGVQQKLYTRKKTNPVPASLLNNKGELISLMALMEFFKDKKLLLTAYASYGVELDKQIAKIPKDQLMIVSFENNVDKERLLLERRRVDFAILFPNEMYQDGDQQRYSQFMAYTIGGLNTPIYSHISCNAHPDSDAFLAEVNATLNKLYTTPEWLQYNLKGWPEEFHPFITDQLNRLAPSHAL